MSATREVTFRTLELGDIPAVVELIAQEVPALHAYQGLSVSKKRIEYVLENNLTNASFMCVLAIGGGKVVGGVAAMVTMLAFSIDAVAQDLFFFVKPEWRSLYTANQLIDRYVTWARARRAVLITASHTAGVESERMEKLLTRRGFEVVGQNYHLRDTVQERKLA